MAHVELRPRGSANRALLHECAGSWREPAMRLSGAGFLLAWEEQI